jgi:hypothetical protein
VEGTYKKIKLIVLSRILLICKSITPPKLNFFRMIWVCSGLLFSSPELISFCFRIQCGGQRELTVAAAKSLLCRFVDSMDGQPCLQYFGGSH